MMNIRVICFIFFYFITDLIQASQTTQNIYKLAIEESTKYIQRLQLIYGIPCISVAVSVDGDLVWSKGFGFADVENLVPCDGSTVMRIASISKPLTMAVLGKLWENNKIDLDQSIHYYIPNFPQKCFNGKKASMTLRQLASHFSGMRVLNISKYNRTRLNLKWPENPDPGCKQEDEIFKLQRKYDIMLVPEHYNTVTESLKLFQDDPLLYAPETNFDYSNTGYNLLGAVIENVTGVPFPEYVRKFFQQWGMFDTFAENHEMLKANRANYYFRNWQAALLNTPYYDLSNMWPSAGMWSTAEDLIKFSNIILKSFQAENKNINEFWDDHLFLKSETVKMLWTPYNPKAKLILNDHEIGYGLGWLLMPPKSKCESCEKLEGFGHTGGLNGTNTAFFVFPQKFNKTDGRSDPPIGIAVSLLTNLLCCYFTDATYHIAKEFCKIKKTLN